MSAPAARYLRRIVSDIEPTESQKQSAAGSHRYVCKMLATGNFDAVIERSFLIGSYARKTAITPIDDVDVMVQVDPTFWKIPFLSVLPELGVVVKSLHGIIKRRYPTSGVVNQRRSVGLLLSKRSLDIVPAVATGEESVFLIPDTRAEEWIETAPERHTWRVQEQNRTQSYD